MPRFRSPAAALRLPAAGRPERLFGLPHRPAPGHRRPAPPACTGWTCTPPAWNARSANTPSPARHLSLAPEVIDLLAGSGDGARVNTYLEKLNERAGTLSIYVMDTQGKVLATSNWRRPDSFLGEDLSFRPYFREALETGSGRFGIGTTRGEPGYHLASALTGDNGTLGVAVIRSASSNWKIVDHCQKRRCWPPTKTAWSSCRR